MKWFVGIAFLIVAVAVATTAVGQGRAGAPAPAGPGVQAAPEQPLVPNAALEGIIVRYGTNEPVSKATVELTSVSGGVPTQTTTTEADGRYYFPKTFSGSYRVYAKRDGYWHAEYGQRWIDGPGQALTLAAGQQLSNVQVVMTPGGVIAGRITNRSGLPMAGARIRAMKPWIFDNQRQLRVVQEVVANDLGEYRMIWLLPGRYYISATFFDYAPTGQPTQLIIDPDATAGGNASRSVSRPVTNQDLSTGLAADEVYTPIYFPTTLDSDKAVALELKQGEEYQGADINVSPVRAFHVRGQVANLPAPPAPAAGAPGAAGPRAVPGAPGAPGAPPAAPPMQVRLAPLSPNGSLYSTQSNGTTGQFDFTKVITGNYVAYLFTNNMTIRSNIEVRNGDLDGLYLPIAAGLDIPVTVTLDGQPPPNFPNIATLFPTLFRNPTILQAPSMPSTRTVPLALQNIAPGDYHVYLNPLLPPVGGSLPNPLTTTPSWQGAYVKSMRMGDVDVLNGGLKLERQPEVGLDIVIGANPGRLEGRVLNDKREPVVGAVVSLLSDIPANRIYRSDMYKVTSTDTAGRFQVLNLPPGDYKVWGWENVERGTWMDPTFLRLYEDRGVTIKIEEGKAHTIEVPSNQPTR